MKPLPLLSEMARIMRPGARRAILEFFRPESTGTRAFHGAYNRLALPVMGRLLSADAGAYRYLVESMERFASLPEFLDSAAHSGFREVKGGLLFPGVCGLVTGVRA